MAALAAAVATFASIGGSAASGKVTDPSEGRVRTPTIPKAKALAPLTLGFSAGADGAVASGNAATQFFWVPRAQHEAAQMVRLDVSWSQVAPTTLPSGFDASNPASLGYNWTKVDEQVRELAAAGFRIMILVASAPKWAEGPNRPKSAGAGTWEPNATDLGQFATAISERYSGSYPDPLNPGAKLPTVTYWQAWDEPNLPEHLTPQWSYSAANGFQPVSPGLYRNMENAFYTAVKGVSSNNYVILAGLAPYGDDPSTAPLARMHPVAFERYLFCLNADLTAASNCAGPTYFDAIDSHPYGIYGPTWHAYAADDVSVPDVYKVAAALKAAENAGTALPKGAKGDWVTEISWDTDPPDPDGIPVQKEANWLEQSLYILWKQGVSTVLWWQLADSPPIPSYSATYQAGVYFLNGTPKPSAAAFRFPFVTWRKNYKTVTTWTHTPTAGTLAIQRQTNHGWQTLTQVRVAANEVVEVPVHLVLKATLRARLKASASLPWFQAG